MSNKNFNGGEINAFDTSGTSPGIFPDLLDGPIFELDRTKPKEALRRPFKPDMERIFGDQAMATITQVSKRSGITAELLRHHMLKGNLTGVQLETPGGYQKVFISRDSFHLFLKGSQPQP